MTAISLDGLPERWATAPRLWGHPLHSLCSYFAMFPPRLASFFVRWLTQPGDVVYDPFAGRGTVPLEALLHDRIGLGSDANPLAHALTRAKVRVPSERSVLRRLGELRSQYAETDHAADDVPDRIRMLYAPGTLSQLAFLRTHLGANRRVDPFVTGLVLGMLHANHSGGGATRGFSISMPNTFAMAPGYVRDYIARNRLVAPELDVFGMLAARVRRYNLPDTAIDGGRSWIHDATTPSPSWLLETRPKLVFASPPYLQVIKYGKYNWVRLWFLHQDARATDKRLMASGSLPRYLDFMSEVLANMKQTVADDGYLCLVIGDVRKGEKQINLADEVWRQVAEPAGWRCHGIVADALPKGVKVSRIWKNNPGRATKVDRLLLLSPSDEVSLPDLPEVDWSVQPSLRREGRKELS